MSIYSKGWVSQTGMTLRVCIVRDCSVNAFRSCSNRLFDRSQLTAHISVSGRRRLFALLRMAPMLLTSPWQQQQWCR